MKHQETSRIFLYFLVMILRLNSTWKLIIQQEESETIIKDYAALSVLVMVVLCFYTLTVVIKIHYYREQASQNLK